MSQRDSVIEIVVPGTDASVRLYLFAVDEDSFNDFYIEIPKHGLHGEFWTHGPEAVVLTILFEALLGQNN